MGKVAVKNIESTASLDISAHGRSEYAGPYIVQVEVEVQAGSHRKAVDIVESRLEGDGERRDG